MSAERLGQTEDLGQKEAWGEDAFDLDVRILPAADPLPPRVNASGTCGGCPSYTEDGSSCKTTCHTCHPTDPTCTGCEPGGD